MPAQVAISRGWRRSRALGRPRARAGAPTRSRGTRASRPAKSTMTVSTIAVAIVSMPTNKNGRPKAKSTASKSATPPRMPGNAVPRNDVQLPEDAEESQRRASTMTRTVRETRVDVRSEEERERADADQRRRCRAASASRSAAEHPEREQQRRSPPDRSQSARSVSAQVYDSVRRALLARCSSRERRIERGLDRARDMRAHARRSVFSVRIAPGRLKAGTIDVLVDHRSGDRCVVVIALRGRFELGAQRGDRSSPVFGIGSAAPIEAPGAMTIWLARERDQRRRRIGALADVRDHRHLAPKRAHREFEMPASTRPPGLLTSSTIARRARALASLDGALDEVRHAVVDGAL